MSFTVDYEALYEYDDDKDGITVPVALQLGSRSFPLAAKLDTGSTYCIFEREVGEWRGINIEQGRPQWIGTVTGKFKTYGHTVTLQVLDFEFDVMVYFAAQPDLGRNVLGRFGFLQIMNCGLIDYESKLFLGRHGI